ncbi:MAG: preprotein translocase subunit SecE [Desulfobulbaceae bacterium]|nr:preprotein translocase subunit SecE [Desulfobulbaceae bacterium]
MTTKMEKSSKGKKVSEAAVVKQGGFGMSRVSKFVEDVKNEFGKIVWPNKKQTIGSTVVVVVLVMLISVYLGAVDLFLGKFIGYVLR